MEHKYKKRHHQVLNPFIGFGWYTGIRSAKERLELKTKSFAELNYER